MLNIGYFKAQPTEYVRQFVRGRLVREGQALSFYYLKHHTSIVVVPTSSIDASFVFNELTGNFQAVAVQGQFTYRIHDPRRAAELFNFAIDPARRAHVSEDPLRLQQRITNVIQMETRRELQRLSLEEALRTATQIAAAVRERTSAQGLLAPLGAELLSIHFTSLSPRPEVGKALEAEQRESLLRRADEAIYARRAATVEEERKIKENELNTQITLEQQRQQLIALEGSNAQEEAENRGKALELEASYRARATEMELSAYRSLDPRTILSLGMKELGQNAGQIGNLTITSEILAALLDGGRAMSGGE
jgi:hypothetical protein